MNYTLKIKSKDLELLNGINPYTYMESTSDLNIFKYSIYPFFKYYFEKTPKVEIIGGQLEKKCNLSLSGDSICICLSSNNFSTLILNIFSKRYIYLNKDEATKDMERTWKTIENKVDFTKVKKVYFCYSHWSKIVYAYRMSKMYNVNIEDITY